MSAIQKKPYIRNVLDSMEDEEKVTLLQLVDGKQNKPTPKSLINPSQHITGADKLLTPEYIALETKEGVYTGYLIYNDDYCTLVTYEDGSQNLDILDIDLSNMTYKVNGENTSIADMRFEIDASKVAKLTGKIPYLDTAPTADNTPGFLTIVVLPAEPATRYNGYLYIITAAAQ